MFIYILFITILAALFTIKAVLTLKYKFKNKIPFDYFEDFDNPPNIYLVIIVVSFILSFIIINLIALISWYIYNTPLTF